MPKKIIQYSVLVASPSDVMNERRVIRQTMHDWNTSVGQTLGVNLEPIMWETHATPEMGDRPQAIINRQIVDECDILVGVFWTRLGSPTGVAVSGTAEEISLFVEAKKPALVYFSSMLINPIGFDVEQFQKLLAFKLALQTQGLQGGFGDLEELRTNLHADLTRTLNHLQKATVTIQDDMKTALEEDELDVEKAKAAIGINSIPFDSLPKKDRDFWRSRAIKDLTEQGATSIGPNALNNMAEALYREATQTTEDLRQEFFAMQRAAMRRDRVSEDVKKAASRLPQEGNK